MKRYHLLQNLFFTFFKIGLFTFGGGYAMIPIIENQCVTLKHWISHEDMMTITIIAESTPGPIAINCATFVGYKQNGCLGAIFSTLGVIMPSFIIIYIISIFFNHFLDITIIQYAFQGIKIAVGILILEAGIRMLKQMKKTVLSYFIMLGSLLMILLNNIFSFNFSSMTLMLLAAILSLSMMIISPLYVNKGGSKQ